VLKFDPDHPIIEDILKFCLVQSSLEKVVDVSATKEKLYKVWISIIFIGIY
jgi:hypothetical protein